MLEMIRTLFQLQGYLAGYKTYLAAVAGVMAALAQFITGELIPYADGQVTLSAMMTNGIPALVAQLAVFFAVGGLRAGVEGEEVDTT